MRQSEVAELASEIGGEPISQASYQKLESRDSESSAYLFALAKALRVNPEWLQTGEGESGLDQYAWKPTPQLEPDEAELLRAYRSSVDVWKLTIRLIASATPNLQPDLSRDINMLMARFVGGPVRPVSDERMREQLKTSREGFPPRPTAKEKK